MQVLLYNSQFFHQKYGGVSRYAACLAKELIKKKVDINIISPIYKNNYLKEINTSNTRGLYLPKYPNLKFLKFINNTLVSFYKKNIKTNIHHDLYYPEKLNTHTKKKILTVHDTIHEKYKNLYQTDHFDFRKKIIENIDIFICVSQNTKEDFINFYKVDENKIYVVSHGHEHLKNVQAQNFKKSGIFEKPFILYVGGRYKYKNFKLLAEAYSKDNHIYDNFNIICYGGENISNNEISLFKQLGINKKIFHLNGNDSFLKTLYKNCSLYVSTSEYEGFGLTILEAIYSNCKILSNDIDVFKKIYNNAINYFEFNNLDHLIIQIQDILLNNRDNAKREDIKKVLQENSWESTAYKTEKIYNLVNNI